MSRLLPLTLAARLVGVARGALQKKIRNGELAVCAIAVPIYNRQGRIIAAIGGPSPVSRMTPARIQEIAAAFKGPAQDISRRMGWRT